MCIMQGVASSLIVKRQIPYMYNACKHEIIWLNKTALMVATRQHPCSNSTIQFALISAGTNLPTVYKVL